MLRRLQPAASTGTPASTSPDGATLDFPKQDITLIVPYAAGGTTDLLARALTTQLSDDLGVNVIPYRMWRAAAVPPVPPRP